MKILRTPNLGPNFTGSYKKKSVVSYLEVLVELDYCWRQGPHKWMHYAYIEALRVT